MAYKFQIGKAKLSGSIETAQAITSQGGLTVNGDVDLDAGVINNTELSGGITNDKLVNSSVSVAGKSVSLGGSILLDTADVTEGTNKYYLDSRARAAISVTDVSGDGSLTYDSGSGVITYTGPSASEVRARISAVDAGGDGSFSYDSGSGVFTYTGPSAAEARAHFSADGQGIEYSSASGQFSLELTGTSLAKSADGLRTNITVNTLPAYQNGAVLFDNANGQLDFKPVEENWVRQRLSAVDAIKYNSGSGSISLQLSGTSLAQSAEGLKADLKTKIGAYDNSGSLSYNVADGQFTFRPVDPAWVKGHFSAGAGLDYADGVFSVGTGEVTNSMLSGGIENAKLVNSAVSVVAGNGLTDGGLVSLGGSVTLNVSASSADAIQVGPDGIDLMPIIGGDRSFTGTVTINNLNVTGTLTTINTTNLEVEDARILMASGSTAWATDVGFDFGSHAGHGTLLTADVNIDGVSGAEHVLSSSLPLVAPAISATSLYGNLVGSMQLNVISKATSYSLLSGDNVVKATANITLTLPSGAVLGQEHRVKCFVSDSASPAPAVVVSGPMEDGSASVTLESFGAAASFVWDGSAWMIF